MKICSVCEIEKDLTEFDHKKGRPAGYCKECRREKIRQHYRDNVPYYVAKAGKRNKVTKQDNRIWLIKYLQEHPCESCGNSDIEVLEFDHLDRELKGGEVSRFLTCSLERLQAEVTKCRVLCANCHRKWTRKQMG